MGAQSSVLMHVCMSVYVFGAWVYSHHVCTWRPEVDIEYLPQLFSTLVFEVDSIVEPGTHWFSKPGWLTSLRSSCLCLPGTSIVYAHYICIQISAWVLSNWPQALLLAHWVFYWLNHFPSLSFFFFQTQSYTQTFWSILSITSNLCYLTNSGSSCLPETWKGLCCFHLRWCVGW